MNGHLCRCGYDAANSGDLVRHIASWIRWFQESGQAGRDLEHVEA